jgi:WD40 repeat protein
VRGAIVRRFADHDAAVFMTRFHPDGRWLVSGDEAGRLCLRRVDAERCHTWLDGHTGGVVDATFTEDGAIFTASMDGTVREWRPTYGLTPAELYAEITRQPGDR